MSTAAAQPTAAGTADAASVEAASYVDLDRLVDALEALLLSRRAPPKGTDMLEVVRMLSEPRADDATR